MRGTTCVQRYGRFGEKRVWHNDAAYKDPYMSMLSSPLRRCIVSDRILPSAMMVSLRAVRLPKDETGTAFQNTLVPARILEQERMPKGKSIWVACWHEAMSALLRKGSYKRLMPNLVAPANMNERVKSQLARSVVHEASTLDSDDRVSVYAVDSNTELPAQTRILLDLREPIDPADEIMLVQDGVRTFRIRSFLESAIVPPGVEPPLETLLSVLNKFSQSGALGTLAEEAPEGAVGRLYALSASDEHFRRLSPLIRSLFRARWWTGQGWN